MVESTAPVPLPMLAVNVDFSVTTFILIIGSVADPGVVILPTGSGLSETRIPDPALILVRISYKIPSILLLYYLFDNLDLLL
jgi:hypothetical protein